jgi:L,D-peptidoglycan transpeptidase YkuD (ErfK/YbiS/YcfS/YnhG family)
MALIALPFFAISCASLVKAPGPTFSSQQALVVTTLNWDAAEASLQCFERGNSEIAWRAVAAPIPVMVGRNGMAWGAGLHPGTSLEGPRKREGDGKAPAGIFRLSTTFGYDPPDDARWIKMPYRQATASLQCVDDGQSPHYNTLVDTYGDSPSWSSHEDMLRPDGQYRLGIFIDHNSDPPIAGGGSCIFLHIGKGPSLPTSGCTALAAPEIERILLWLDPAKAPILIQLPESEYLLLRADWGLP